MSERKVPGAVMEEIAEVVMGTVTIIVGEITKKVPDTVTEAVMVGAMTGIGVGVGRAQ